MIRVVINGEVAYPDTSQKIKVTYENQFVKDSGSYTYEVQFPMAILENKKIFKNVDRFEVKKKLSDYEDCKLYVDNRIIISGKGTVTKIDNTKVCLQIVGGKSRIKYNAKFENHYIDDIDYPSVVLDTGINKQVYEEAGAGYPNMNNTQWGILTDLTTGNIIGQRGVAVLSPTYDETNDIVANRPCLMKLEKLKINGVKFPEGTYSFIVNCAISPYLLYVLRKVMEYEGYTIRRNDLDKTPWNRLVIVSACKSGKIKDALPHWTVYKFIDELRKFFNASFVFNEIGKTVDVLATNELLSNEMITYDCEDEFSVDYDEEGLDNLATSNIEYSFDNSANRDWREYISQSVQRNYPIKTYTSYNDMVAAAKKMGTKERKSTIFKVNYDYYVWADLPKDGNPETEETSEQCTLCGIFNPIIRDMNSDTFQDLNICPSAIYQRRLRTGKVDVYTLLGDKLGNPFVVVPSITNKKEQSFEDMKVDEDGEYYYSVQDAMQGNSPETTSSSNVDEGKMSVAFQAQNVLNLQAHSATPYDKKLDNEDTRYRVPVLYTDYRIYPGVLFRESGSLALEALPELSFGNGGQSATPTERYGKVDIDKNNQITIKFITDDIPDPSKIYVFNNKRYICEKVEMNVTDDGIDKEKTGYFYEIL